MVTVHCPHCLAMYESWVRASVNLDLDPDMDLADAFGVTCPHCELHLPDSWWEEGDDGIARAIPIVALEFSWRRLRDDEARGATHEAVRIRLHRAFSWINRAHGLIDMGDSDGTLIYSWIALNALYAKWSLSDASHDDSRNEPDQRLPEWRIRRDFLEDMAQRDAEGHIQQYLKSVRPMCDRLLSEEHLHAFYWADPTPEAARKARSSARQAGKSYHAREDIEKVLLPLIDRIAMLRGQLVHGQSTHGSSVNRDVVEPAAALLRGLVVEILKIIIDGDVWAEATLWEPLPFPPQSPHFRR